MDLKKDLDEYLLLQSDQKKTFKISLPTIQKPSLKWFGRKEELSEDSWFKESRSSCCPSLSRIQRIIGFVISVGMGVLCFTISMFYIPVLLFKARKFALLFTLGSTFILMSFSFLWGPLAFVKHMLSRDRLLLSLTYTFTLTATLYCALHLQSTPFTVLFAVGQVVALLWTVIANVPGGSTGLSFFGKIFTKTVTQTLPI